MALYLVLEYFIWHYTRAFADLVIILGNFFRFLVHFFSVPEIWRTLFAPWRRLGEVYGSPYDLNAVAETFIVNTLMRLVGLIIRLGLLVIFSSSLVLWLVVSGLFLIGWLVVPFLLIVTVAAASRVFFFS